MAVPPDVYVIGSVVLLVIWWWFFCLAPEDDDEHNRSRDAFEALRSPGVRAARSAFDRRVALAVREAKLGYYVCEGCGFTNTVRAASCVACGSSATVDRGPHSVAAVSRKNRGDSDRQRRVRRRKEWTRGFDTSGHVVWRQNKQVAGSVSEIDLHYTLEVPNSAPISSGDLVTEPSVSDQSVVDTTQSPVCDPSVVNIVVAVQNVDGEAELANVGTVTNIAQSLYDEVKMRPSTVAVVYDGSPVRGVFASTHVNGDVVTLSELDFPSKLARFITSMAALSKESGVTDLEDVLQLCTTRDTLLADSLTILATLPSTRVRHPIRVEFVGQQGIDAGGVYREWYVLLNEHLIHPQSGIFACVDKTEQTFYLNPLSQDDVGQDHLAYILAAGRILGRALLEGNVTGFHLALPLLKIILGLPVGFNDLQYFDPDTHKNLKWLLENEGADLLGLDFTVTEVLPNGQTREFELVPGGSQIEVTDGNKHEYVELKVKYLFFDHVESQLFAFLKGLYEVVPAELLVLFDAEELDYVLSGSDEIDVDDWQSHAIISRNLFYHPAAELFWKAARELSPGERRRLLQFATGSSRVPPGGFATLTSHDGRLCLFTLQGVDPKVTRGYLRSHACFNRVDLPMHWSVREMNEAVQAAIAGEPTGFTVA